MAMRTHETSTNHPAAAAAAANKPHVNPQIPSAPSTAAAASTTSKLDTRTDGTLSDSVLSTQTDTGKKRRPSMSSKALVILGLSKKTNSASNLGHGNHYCLQPPLSNIFVLFFVLAKRFGFQRSEEIGVQPHLRSRALQRQTSKENETPATGTSQTPLAAAHQHHSMPHDMK